MNKIEYKTWYERTMGKKQAKAYADKIRQRAFTITLKKSCFLPRTLFRKNNKKISGLFWLKFHKDITTIF